MQGMAARGAGSEATGSALSIDHASNAHVFESFLITVESIAIERFEAESFRLQKRLSEIQASLSILANCEYSRHTLLRKRTFSWRFLVAPMEVAAFLDYGSGRLRHLPAPH
jgi:hypothetical protein